MSYISDLHDYSAESAEKMGDKAKEYITPALKENLRKEINQIFNQIFDQEYGRLEEYAAEFLENCAAHRAEEFFKRVLDGDDKAAMALLGDHDNSDRYKQIGYNKGEPWPYMIRGMLGGCTGGIEMRKKIVEAFPDLITSERIKDLEAIVDGLQQQIVKQEKQMERIMSQSIY
jgi:hypothetical protein